LRGNEEQIPLYASHSILFSLHLISLSSAYELYADLSPKYESQPKVTSRPKGKSQKDGPLPKDEPSNTEDLQKGKSSRKEDKDSVKIDGNSGKQEEGSPKKEDKPQENPSSPKKDLSPKGNSSKSKNGSRKDWAESQKADDSAEMAKHFKKTFSRQYVKVHFIGVWCVPIVIVMFAGF
jgi:hypothetical protein